MGPQRLKLTPAVFDLGTRNISSSRSNCYLTAFGYLKRPGGLLRLRLVFPIYLPYLHLRHYPNGGEADSVVVVAVPALGKPQVLQ